MVPKRVKQCRHMFRVQTSGVEVVVAPIIIPETTVQVELYLLDTAGHELYKDQISQYWNGVYYAILVFDVSSMENFEACKAWYELLKSARCAWGGGQHPYCCKLVDGEVGGGNPR